MSEKIKIIPLVCPKCDGAINVTNKGSGIYKCPYCGTSIYFDDGVSRNESTININKQTKSDNYNHNYNYNVKRNGSIEAIASVVKTALIVFAIIFVALVVYNMSY